MGVQSHPFAWADTGTLTTLGIYLPTTFATGRPQKWLILHSGGGGTWELGVTEARFQALCNTHDLAMVTATQSTAGDAAETWSGWVGGQVVERDHEAQMIALALSLVPELSFYLPSIMGASMGGLCTLRALLNHPERYSAAGAFVGMWDAIYWDSSRGLNGASSPFGQAYPTGDPAKDAWWMMDSPGHRIATADLQGRKIITSHGLADTVIDHDDVYVPSRDAIPAHSLQGAYSITNGGHDWGLFADEAGTQYYGTEVFQFFAASALPAVDLDVSLGTASIFDVDMFLLGVNDLDVFLAEITGPDWIYNGASGTGVMYGSLTITDWLLQ